MASERSWRAAVPTGWESRNSRAIRRGNVAAEVRKLDYRTATIELSVAATGPSRAAVLLRADPGKRLLLPFSDILDASRLRIMALDRASGLRADEILNRETAGPTATRRPFPSETHFFYLLPTVKAGAPRTVVSDPRTFESMRAWGLRFAGNLRAIVARVNLLGLSADGDVVLVTGSNRRRLWPWIEHVASYSTPKPARRRAGVKSFKEVSWRDSLPTGALYTS